MPPTPRSRPANRFPVCNTCAEFYRSHGGNPLVLCQSCVESLNNVIRDGYLQSLNLGLSDLYQIQVEEGESISTYPVLVLYRNNIPVEEVGTVPPTNDEISLALGFFESRSLLTISIIGFDSRYQSGQFRSALGPFMANDSQSVESNYRPEWRNCHHCHSEMLSHPATDGMLSLGTDANYVSFCSTRCRNMHRECSHCNAVFNRDSVSAVESPTGDIRYLCPSCFEHSMVPCAACRSRASSYEMRTTRIGSVCRRCYNHSTVECSHCHRGRSSFEMDDILNPDTGEVELRLCRGCFEQFESRVHRYDYRPRRFNFTGDPPFYGIELEVDHFPTEYVRHSKKIHKLSEDERFFFLKRDGSLNNGLELVFHPRSIQSWEHSWPKVEEVINTIKTEGATAWDPGTCGFHIHRSKHDLTRVTELKLCILLKIMKARFIKIAQRQNDRYAGWDIFDNQMLPVSDRRFKASSWRAIKSGIHKINRYQCINFGSNRDTWEFRLYKGTLFTPTLKAYLGFTHQMVEFANTILVNETTFNAHCKKCGRKTSQCDKWHETSIWNQFVEFLNKRTKEPFVLECLDFLHRLKLGHPDWTPIITDWKEV